MVVCPCMCECVCTLVSVHVSMWIYIYISHTSIAKGHPSSSSSRGDSVIGTRCAHVPPSWREREWPPRSCWWPSIPHLVSCHFHRDTLWPSRLVSADNVWVVWFSKGLDFTGVEVTLVFPIIGPPLWDLLCSPTHAREFLTRCPIIYDTKENYPLQ